MLYSKIVVAFLDNYSYLTAMTPTLNQVSSDRAFINGFKDQMAYYRHMCRMAQNLIARPDLSKLLDPELVEKLVAWEDLGAMTGVPDSHPLRFLLTAWHSDRIL